VKAREAQKKKKKKKKKKMMPVHAMIPSLHAVVWKFFVSSGSWVGMVKHSIQFAGEGVDDERIPTQI